MNRSHASGCIISSGVRDSRSRRSARGSSPSAARRPVSLCLSASSAFSCSIIALFRVITPGEKSASGILCGKTTATCWRLSRCWNSRHGPAKTSSFWRETGSSKRVPSAASFSLVWPRTSSLSTPKCETLKPPPAWQSASGLPHGPMTPRPEPLTAGRSGQGVPESAGRSMTGLTDCRSLSSKLVFPILEIPSGA